MTVTAPSDGGAEQAPAQFCGLCGRPMEPDQEWCLECGAARTVIARPPDWRVPVLVIGVIVLLIAGGFAYAMTRLGSHAGRVTVVNPATARSAPATAASIGSWPPGLDGYTVILATETSRSAADADARTLSSSVADVGVLSTTQHPATGKPGQWDVYAGRYPSYDAAQAGADKLAKAGQPEAKPHVVAHPGQA